MNKKIYFLLFGLIILSFTDVFSQDTSKPLGKISGSVDVSAAGGAVYSIPIAVPPGTKGIQPNITLTYNSQAGVGVMGKGWNISGLSAISRSGKTFYHDNKSEKIKFDDTDHFVFDGMTLIPVNGNSGADNTEYRTEIESYVRFFSRGRIGNSPDHFEAKMKDGSVVEYGSNTNSRVNTLMKLDNTIQTRNEPMSWNVSKITDEFGNYMTFSYIKESANIYNSTWSSNYLISEINYTGNAVANQLPYNKIVFEYEDYSNYGHYYFDGVDCKKTKRLKKIKTYAEGQLVKTYEIIYSTNTSNTLFSVSEIKEINYLGEELNSTKFDWNLSDNVNLTFQNGAININGLAEENYHEGPLNKVFNRVGDVDGDGFKDIIIIGNKIPNQDYFRIYLYKNTGNNSFVEIIDQRYNRLSSSDLNNVFLADINHDGKDELMVVRKTDIQMFNYNSDGSSFNETGVINDDGVELNLSSDYLIGIGSETKYQHMFCDINGDGISDLLIINEKVIKYRLGIITDGLYSLGEALSSNIGIHSYFFEGNKLFMSDVNGDGMQDIVIFRSNAVKVNLSNGSGFGDELIWTTAFTSNNGWVNGKHDIQMVDINGDGMSDIAGFGDSQLYVYFSTGQSFEPNEGDQYGFQFPWEEWNPSANPRYFVDLNNDGLVDLLGFKHDGTTVAYLNNGHGLTPVYDSYRFGGDEVSRSPRIISDFNGDMIPDLLKVAIDANGYSIIDLGNKKDNIIIDSITDGFHNNIKIDYDFFRRSYRGQSFSYPFTTLFYPLHLAKKIKYFSKDIFVNSISYDFDAPISHMQGKGFLGFENVAIKDSINQTINTKTFTLDQSTPVLKLTDEVLDAGINSKSIQHAFNVRQIGTQKHFVYEKTAETIDDSYSKSSTHTEWTRDDNGNITKVIKEIKLNVRAGVVDPHKYTNTVQTIGYVNLGNDWNFKPIYDSTIVSNEKNKIDKQITYYEYLNNKLYKQKHHYTNDTLKNEIQYSNYNAFGYPLQIIHATMNKLRVTDNLYDSKARWLIQTTDPFAVTTLYEYEPKYGNCTKKTDMGGLITNYTYDGWAKLLSTTLPDGEIITNTYIWGYNGSGSVPNCLYSTIKQSNINGKTTTTYDALGRELQIKDETKQITSLSETRYNAKGQVEKKSLPYKVEGISDISKQWTEYTYDQYNRILTEVSPLLLNNTYRYQEGDLTNTVSKIDNIKSVTTTQEYDYLGQVEKSTDNGGDITYIYTATGKPDTITSLNGKTIITYDEAGNRRSITEPNSGTKYSYYNGYGDITKNVDKKGIVSIYTYQGSGRLFKTVITGTDGNFEQIDDVYVTTNIASKGQLQSTTKKLNNISSTAITTSYQYDNLGRISKVTETIDGRSFDKDITYNSLGQILTETYPSYDGTNRLVLQNIYNSRGDLITIKKGDKNLWNREMDNEYGQPLRVTLGNNTGTLYYYNEDNQIKKIQSGTLSTPIAPIDPITQPINPTTFGITIPTFPETKIPGSNIQKWVYEYNTKGLMSSRQDSLLMQKETFAYDNLDRLTSINITELNGTLFSLYSNAITYDNQGNIQTKSDAGTFGYNTSDKPNAIKSINNTRVGRLSPPFFNTISTETLNTTYNSYNKIDKITKGNKELKFYYTPSQERIKTEYKENNILQKTTYYIGNYECEVYSNGRIRELSYINTNTGHTIVELKDNNNGTSTDSLYYIFKDHLGSYDRITNQLGQIVEIYSFDAWGNRRKAENWKIKDVSTAKLFNRGFTGHEHLDAFDVINMNGRLYDPVIARFLSPDPYVQLPNNTQNFNRYSYCLNNPLLYTDPSGELFGIDDAIIIGAIMVGTMSNFTLQGMSGNIHNMKDAFLAMGTGALAGAAGALAGGAIAGVIGSTGFISGAGVGAAGAGASGFVLNGGNAWSNGANFVDGLKAGGLGALTGILAGGLTGGIVAGIKAVGAGTNFWTAEKTMTLEPGTYAASGPKGPFDWVVDKAMDLKIKYVGDFNNVHVFENKVLGTGWGSAGMTLNSKNIIVGKGVYSLRNRVLDCKSLLQHEYGHVLQIQEIGQSSFERNIMTESFAAALRKDNTCWTETWANYLSKNYFGKSYVDQSRFGSCVNISSEFLQLLKFGN